MNSCSPFTSRNGFPGWRCHHTNLRPSPVGFHASAWGCADALLPGVHCSRWLFSSKSLMLASRKPNTNGLLACHHGLHQSPRLIGCPRLNSVRAAKSELAGRRKHSSILRQKRKLKSLVIAPNQVRIMIAITVFGFRQKSSNKEGRQLLRLTQGAHRPEFTPLSAGTTDESQPARARLANNTRVNVAGFSEFSESGGACP